MAPIPLLHVDPHLIVVDKPAGLLTVPAPGRSGPTLVDLLRAQLQKPVIPVHRLDEDTTGVLILALDTATETDLVELFRRHAVERHYLALASQTPSPPAGRIEANLTEGSDGMVRVATRGGQRAVTQYATIGRRGRCCLLHCQLETGRRNQIRVHLAALGCPLAGDRKYGFRLRTEERFSRVMLHSWRLRFEHPRTRAEVAVAVDAAEAELRI
jgi:23S rRNA pseudouridine1911/1915/1917 synthase